MIDLASVSPTRPLFKGRFMYRGSGFESATLASPSTFAFDDDAQLISQMYPGTLDVNICNHQRHDG